MRSLRTLVAPLGPHLAGLRDTLEGLAERLRAAVAGAVGGAVAGAVREAVHALLAERGRRDPAPLALDYEDPEPRAPSWGRRDEQQPWRRPAASREEGGFDDDFDCEEQASPPKPDPEPARRLRWCAAVAAGLQAAAWWLRRKAGAAP